MSMSKSFPLCDLPLFAPKSTIPRPLRQRDWRNPDVVKGVRAIVNQGSQGDPFQGLGMSIKAMSPSWQGGECPVLPRRLKGTQNGIKKAPFSHFALAPFVRSPIRFRLTDSRLDASRDLPAPPCSCTPRHSLDHSIVIVPAFRMLGPFRIPGWRPVGWA